MKTAMKRTVFTVKLRKMDYKEEWSLYIEAFPVFVANKKNPVRQHETLNRYVTTPIWDKNSVSKTRNDKKYYRPKRDSNGIIQCRSQQDQQSCIFAEQVRALRQHEYDNRYLYTDTEAEQMAQNERSYCDFIRYFEELIDRRHANSSDSIRTNWKREATLLKEFSQGEPILFKDINVTLIEKFRDFLINAPQAGGKKGTISRNTASTYFSILKAGLHQAFIDEYLTVDLAAKVKNIKY